MKKFFVSVVIAALFVGFTSCKDDNTDENGDVVLAGVTLEGTKSVLNIDETLDLTVKYFPADATHKDLEWTSSNEAVAMVENGKVTALSEGSAAITAVSVKNNEVSDTYSITVLPKDVEVTILTVEGAQTGVWPKDAIVYVVDQIWVEKGAKLTVEEGVTIIMKDGPVGTSGAPVEFYVDGSLYLRGTTEKPVLVTVEHALRTEANRYAGLWGGFVGGNDFSEMLFDNVIVEYTGALCGVGSQSVINGLNVADKDQTAQILTNNPSGNIVVINSTFRYANSDALYFMGGNAIVANNIIHTIGENDNDGINMKAGVKVDIAFNLCFSVNSNALKLSSSGQGPGRDQALIRAYNNTIVNSGWRRTKNLKGGSIFLEQGALASVYNNLIVNSKLMLKTPSLNNPTFNKGGCDHNSFVGYNFYASGSQQLTNPTLLTIDGVTLTTAFAGYTYADEDYWHDWDNYPANYPKIDQTSLVATAAGTPNPNFVNFPFNSVPLDRDLFDASWDFHVNAGSPVLVGAEGKEPKSAPFTSEFVPYFGTTGLMIDGKMYTTPAPKAQYGAFGTK